MAKAAAAVAAARAAADRDPLDARLECRSAVGVVSNASDAAFVDADTLSRTNPADPFRRPLWPEGELPELRAQDYDKLRAFWQQDPHVWTFWESGYADMLAGRPVDWDLLRQVVLLPDEDWNAGPERIADRIEELRARIGLQRRIEELERQLAAAARDRTGMGGNNPPKPIETEAELMIVWQPLEELKAEAGREIPDKDKIRSAISALSGVLAEIGKWTGGKLDRAVDKAIDWSVPAGLGYLALHVAEIRQVIDAAEAWLKTL
ncbi:hypothetical protein [Rhodovulum sp. MB263]|uniref:hypothetical protein n=1 Tax=Rhodovulum sp. (strain MB263) TaxID=308754 RepID=UPI0012DAF8BE|nr:hypothetical protein [Rhodovulum sp. MB263]